MSVIDCLQSLECSLSDRLQLPCSSNPNNQQPTHSLNIYVCPFQTPDLTVSPKLVYVGLYSLTVYEFICPFG